MLQRMQGVASELHEFSQSEVTFCALQNIDTPRVQIRLSVRRCNNMETEWRTLSIRAIELFMDDDRHCKQS